MSTINIEAFCAGTFDFYIGPERVRFVLYRNLVARYSNPLGKMMSNGMKESQEGAAFLEHVDSETFGRFAEYIHSGDYSSAAPVDALPTSPTPPAPEEPDGWYRHRPTNRVLIPPLSPEEPITQDAVVEVEPEVEPPAISDYSRSGTPVAEPMPQPFPLIPAPGRNQTSSSSYSPVFRSHVCVYHFAQQYLIPGLKELAQQKLADTFNLFRCYPERAGDICEIIQLVYNHEDGNMDDCPLQKIVTEYAINNFIVLVETTHFKNLLAEGGTFPVDLCSRIASQLL
ncbi:hypothetical protein MPH_12462 [Macrophomina phaseolina MS6]|uniref:BTB domain-containing protein n=1 Tax=Macrophomina phaseolina (strain MS6) TaxID=1126212 RepID=K2RKG2_MACPH|nr:hypothetical protein MPH_12462 [Macrophomina phaseolina MS6]